MRQHRSTAVTTALLAVALSACGSGSHVTTAAAPAQVTTTTAPGTVPPNAGTAPAATPGPTSTPTNEPALDDLASALGEQGRGAYKSVFGELDLDNDAHAVELYATDTAKARDLVHAAATAHPGLDTTKVTILACPYTQATVDPVINRIMSAPRGSFPAPIYSAALAPRAAGVVVTTDHTGAATPALHDALAQLTHGIAVFVTEGQPLTFDNAVKPVQ